MTYFLDQNTVWNTDPAEMTGQEIDLHLDSSLDPTQTHLEHSPTPEPNSWHDQGSQHQFALELDLNHDGLPDQFSFILDDHLHLTHEQIHYSDPHYGIDHNGHAFYQSTPSDGQIHIPAAPALIGNPSAAMSVWHHQEKNNTCAVVCQEFVLDQVVSKDSPHWNENQLYQFALQNGWFHNGTTQQDMSKLLEAVHIPVRHEEQATLDDMANHLMQGEKVIVAINGDKIWQNPDQSLMDLNGTIPGQGANHAVMVIGIDNQDPNHPKIILNDPGSPNGCGNAVPAAQFLHAWDASNRYMVSTMLNSAAPLTI